MECSFRHQYAKDKGGKGGPPPSARPLPTGPAEPPKLEEVETPDFGEDKPFTADISDFPDPKEWKKVSNWEEFQFSPKVKKIAEAMFQLNQVETFELLKLLQLRFDVPDSALMGGGVVVQAAAPGTPAPAGATPGGDAPSAQAQSEAKAEKMIFDVQLVAVNEADKFKVLKEIRTMKPGMKLLEVSRPLHLARSCFLMTCIRPVQGNGGEAPIYAQAERSKR